MRSKNRSTKKIYIAEDDAMLREVLKATLQSEGYVVDAFMTGEDLVEVVHSATPDLIVLDFLLPQANGGEITRYLRTLPYATNVPIIIISASNVAQQEAHMSGANGFIAKPFEISTLIQTVNDYLH